MKKLLSALAIIASLPTMAQEKFTTYHNSKPNEAFEIKLNSPKSGKFELLIDAQSLDTTVRKGGFILENKTYQGFIDNLTEAKAKYIEWSATAKQNNVTDLIKPIKVKPKRVEGFFLSDSKPQYDFNVTPTFTFKVGGTGGKTDYILLVNSGEMVASGNQNINADAFVISFSTVDEIDSFINAIKWEKIMAHINKPKATDLFK